MKGKKDRLRFGLINPRAIQRHDQFLEDVVLTFSGVPIKAIGAFVQGFIVFLRYPQAS